MRDTFGSSSVTITSTAATVCLLPPDVFATIDRDGEVTIWDSHGTDYSSILEEALADAGIAIGNPVDVVVAVATTLERVAGDASS